MSGVITWEAELFIRAFQLGIILMVIYDCLRIFRMILPHNIIVISIEDFTYWIFNGLAVFRLLYLENDGVIRGFALIGLFMGMLLYCWLVSPLILGLIKKLIKLLQKALKSFTISFKKR